MIHLLDREDRVLHQRALKKLDSWISEYKKTAPAPHPFKIVGADKPRSLNDRIARKS